MGVRRAVPDDPGDFDGIPVEEQGFAERVAPAEVFRGQGFRKDDRPGAGEPVRPAAAEEGDGQDVEEFRVGIDDLVFGEDVRPAFEEGGRQFRWIRAVISTSGKSCRRVGAASSLVEADGFPLLKLEVTRSR